MTTSNWHDVAVEDDGQIECPLHLARFDIRSDRARCEPLQRGLAAHPVHIEGGRVWVHMSAE